MRFEPGDFEPIVGYHNELADKIAARANGMLAAWLDAAPESTADHDPRWSDAQIDEWWDKPPDGREWHFKMVDVREVRK